MGAREQEREDKKTGHRKADGGGEGRGREEMAMTSLWKPIWWLAKHQAMGKMG